MPGYISKDQIVNEINKFLKITFLKHPPSELEELKIDQIPDEVISRIEKAQKSLTGLRIILEKRLEFYKLLKHILTVLESQSELIKIKNFVEFYKTQIIKLRELHTDFVREIQSEKENLEALELVLDSLDIAIVRDKHIKEIIEYDAQEEKGLIIKIGEALESGSVEKVNELLKNLKKNIELSI
jgi:hypothetical protein